LIYRCGQSNRHQAKATVNRSINCCGHLRATATVNEILTVVVSLRSPKRLTPLTVVVALSRPRLLMVLTVAGGLGKPQRLMIFRIKIKGFWKFGFEFETEFSQIQTQIIKQKIRIQRRNTYITYEAEDTYT
jgi:hypothetical protein